MSDILNDLPEIAAYKLIPKPFLESHDLNNGEELYKETCQKLEKVIYLLSELESPLVEEIKPILGFTLKWKFDYLAKTGESPFNLIKDINFWISQLNMLTDLKEHNWFQLNGKTNSNDVWKLTKEAFNFMWPKNTDGDQYHISKKMVELRVKQIVELLEGQGSTIENKVILDSGCGPGRYTDVALAYNPSKVIGLDQGKDILEENRKRFEKNNNVEMVQGSCDELPFEEDTFDFIISAGVIHHLSTPISTTMKEHARVLKKNGSMFVFIAGEGGLELEMWKFLRKLYNNYPIEKLYNTFSGKISPLRIQGLLDHSYGEYQQTSREDFESMLKESFTSFVRVPGIPGLDVTEEVFPEDKYFKYRFGSGNLRYLCKK